MPGSAGTWPPPPGGRTAPSTMVPAAGIGELAAEVAGPQAGYGQDALIVCDRLVRIYQREGIEVQALQGLDLLVTAGELTAVVGASGSGKSTLMNILAGLDTPTAGTVRVAGYDLGGLGPRQRLAYRRDVVGFVWQQASRNLLPYLTGRQNVMLPMRLGRTGRRERAARAGSLLEALQVAHCADRAPGRMSGGERQRTAIATALANRPRILLADEPTGDLDTATAADVLAALTAVNTDLGVTVLVVSHDPAVAAQAHRTVAIRDGRTSSETIRHAATDEFGNATHHAVEYAVLDRAGRVQLPREMMQRLGMRDRVRLEARPDHIGVWPHTPLVPGTQPPVSPPGPWPRQPSPPPPPGARPQHPSPPPPGARPQHPSPPPPGAEQDG